MLSEWNPEFAPREQSHLQLHGEGSITEEAVVHGVVWTRSNKLNAGHRLVANLYLDYIALTVSSSTLHTTQEGWTGFAQ